MNGDVCLRVEGLMLERLMQRAVSEGVRFCSVRRDGSRVMVCEVSSESAAILIAMCERFSISCTVISRRGRDAMLRRLKQRITLLAGIMVGLIAASLFLSRVWLIDIKLIGERAADTQSIQTALSDFGMIPGVAKSDVDPGWLEDVLAASSPEFSYIGVKLEGVRLLVEATPIVPSPELYEISGGCDLVAKCDGVIESVNVLSGVACVRPGDTVVRGQVLIRGNERVAKEVNRPITALGTVVARTWHEGIALLPLERTEEIRTGKSSVSSELRLMDFAWTLLEGESYSSQESEVERLPIGGMFLPLEIRRTTFFETCPKNVENNGEMLKRQLSRLAFAQAGVKLTQSHPEGCEITDRWIEYMQDAGMMSARAVYETHTDIAVTRDGLYQQGG